MRVLIVEDSKALRESLRSGLAREGFAVDVAADGELGLGYARNNPYDVLVLDLMLPKLDGLQLLSRLRPAPRRPHVLCLTARDGVADRVEGLNAGADDYLVKPFAFEELLARIHALVRRRYQESSSRIDVGPLSLDLLARNATVEGRTLELTAREYALLEYLALRRGHTVRREEIEDHIYGVDRLPASNAVDSAICLLRSKLGPLGKELVRTRRGQGYLLDAEGAPATAEDGTGAGDAAPDRRWPRGLAVRGRAVVLVRTIAPRERSFQAFFSHVVLVLVRKFCELAGGIEVRTAAH